MKKHKQGLWLALLVLIGLGAVSCRSGERMLRISPLSNDSSRDRVNLWPIAYHDGGAMSLLWPLFDIDDQGFALRPLIAKDGSDWSALFPLAAWDASDSTGWILGFYKFEENRGLFPLVNLGPFSWFVPFWWKKDSAGRVESGGLFPILLLGGPSYFGPFWWSADRESFGLFPLFGAGDLSHFGPLWWESKLDGGFGAGLFPLLWFKSDGSKFTMLPLYSHSLTDEARTRWYLFGLGHSHHSKDRNRSWLFPLYYHNSTPDAEDTALFPFFVKRTRGEDSHVFTLLGDRSVDPDSSTLNLYPIWWSNESEDSAWQTLLPFYYYEREGDNRTLLTPLGGRGWTVSGETRYVNFLGPLYHKSESLDGEEERTAILWPLFERHRQGDTETLRVLPFYSSEKTSSGRESWYALGLGHGSESPRGSAARLWPFYSRHDLPHGPDVLYDLTLYGSRSHGGKTRRWLFPLFWSATTEKTSDLNFLAGLGGYSRTPDSNAWRLWPLISRTKGIREPNPLYETTLIGSSSWEGGKSSHFVGPFLYRSWESRTESEVHSKTRLLTFFTHEKRVLPGLHLPRGTELEPANRIRRESSGFLFDAFLNRGETYHVWEKGVLTPEEAEVLHPFSSRFDSVSEIEPDREAATQILKDHGYVPEDSGDEAFEHSLTTFAAANTETLVHRKRRFPLIFNYERKGEQLEWSGPLWLLHSKSEAESSKWSFLYYAFRSETRGTQTTRDIFPFITWDSDEEETEVSFLWRLFHYHRKGGQRGGHIFFIPWGDN